MKIALPKAEYGERAVRWHLANCRLQDRRAVLLTFVARDSRKITLTLTWRECLAVAVGMVRGLIRG